MRVLELYAGCGGLAHGFHKAGFKHVALVEFSESCCQTLVANGFHNVLCQDVQDVKFGALRGKVDIVTGGPPCQPFSVGGDMQGDADERNMLDDCVRVVREVQPAAFCFENVNSLCADKFRPYLDRLMHKFRRAGYTMTIYKVDAADYGIPQHRKRCFLIGFRDKVDFQFPQPTGKVKTVRDVFRELGPPNGKHRHELHEAKARAFVDAFHSAGLILGRRLAPS